LSIILPHGPAVRVRWRTHLTEAQLLLQTNKSVQLPFPASIEAISSLSALATRSLILLRSTLGAVSTVGDIMRACDVLQWVIWYLAHPTAAGGAAEAATETLLLDLPDDLLALIVSKLPAAESCSIRHLASTSHRSLRIVLEFCSSSVSARG
jgi:hypothetical protein